MTKRNIASVKRLLKDTGEVVKMACPHSVGDYCPHSINVLEPAHTKGFAARGAATMGEGGAFRDYMLRELAARCKRNPKYSLRAFAKALEMDPSTLAKLLNGKRPLGRRAITGIGTKLGLRPLELDQFVSPSRTAARPEGDDDYKRIAEDAFEIIADWYHYAILEIMTVEDFRPDPKWIARSLGLSLAETRSALSRLMRAGILEVTADGEWHDRSGGKTSSVPLPNVTSTAAKEHERQVLNLALRALDETPPTARDQTSMTLGIDRTKLPEARQIIKNFRRDLAALLCRSGKRTDVYHLSVSLYPVSRSSTSGESDVTH